MADMTFEPPTQTPKKLPVRWVDEHNTKRVRRSMLEGVASGRPEQVVAMVTRARTRGTPYATIATWLGPRTSCPPHLHAIYDRVKLLASIE